MTEPTPHTPAQPNPGQMTMAMKAAAVTGPKVLRVGVVRSGRVVEERVLRERVSVTVGGAERNTFVVAGVDLPPNFCLFELNDGDYYLSFMENMTGRVSQAGGVSDLVALREGATRTPQGAYQVPLSEDARGKVQVGEVSFLFQFVAPPPVAAARPALPLPATPATSEVDWVTTFIAAFSFLVHFMAIGALYSDWLDRPVDDEAAVASLMEAVSRLPAPPPVEVQEEVTQAPAEKAEAKPAKAAKATGAAPAKGGALSEKAAAALVSQLEQLELATLAALSGAGPATDSVLRGGELSTAALDAAAASNSGVSGMGDLALGGGGGVVRPGESGGGDLGSLGTQGKTAGTTGGGEIQKVAPPKGNASVGGVSNAGGTVSNASRVVAGMRAGFRACYQRGLAENPDAQGSIQLRITVGPGGEVSGVSASSSGNLPGSVLGCVKSRAQAARFDPPEGGAAVISVPVTLIKQ